VGQLKLLTVSWLNTPNHESLPLAVKEVDNVVQVVSSVDKDILCLSRSDATTDCVLGELPSHLLDLYHFTCLHGVDFLIQIYCQITQTYKALETIKLVSNHWFPATEKREEGKSKID
jgi:hypothetical protein